MAAAEQLVENMLQLKILRNFILGIKWIRLIAFDSQESFALFEEMKGNFR